MSVADMSIETTIAHIVEAMLPRSSDRKLGLLIRIRMDTHDFGYGDDGNTLVLEPQSYRHELCFLFVRPSNYTKVFLFEPDLDQSFGVVGKENVWNLESDHDSCWRSDGFRRITDVHFALCDPICKARQEYYEKEGIDRKFAPMHVNTMHGLEYDPQYVELEVFDKVHPEADRFSTEGRLMNIKLKGIGFDRLTQYKYMDTYCNGNKGEFRSGLIIEGSECDDSWKKRLDILE